MRIGRGVFLLAIALQGQTYDNLDAVLWAQTSVEYKATVRQTYAAARQSLDRALATPYWTAVAELGGSSLDKPPAIILDLDETVIDNTQYRALRLREGGKPFTLDSWIAWVKEGKASILPGAYEFLQYAHMRGVKVFFVTNRDCGSPPGDPTYRNVKELGLEFAMLRCRTDSSDKAPRRQAIAGSYRVLLLVGDDFNDFLTAHASTLEERQKLYERHAQFFGEQWFMVPNPMYGSWERSFADDHKKKLAALHP